MRSSSKKSLLECVLLALVASLLAAFNLKSFIHAGNLVPGGFSGAAVLATRIADKFFNKEISYSLVYLALNAPVVILVAKTVGKRFTLVSLVVVLATSFIVEFIPVIEITDDLFLICIFGGVVAGFSNSLALRAEGCGGGLDFVAVYLAKRKQKSMWFEMLFINACLITVSGYLFGWKYALYTIVFQFVNTQVVNYFDTRYKRSCFFIITDNPDLIVQEVYKQLNHSVTILKGVGSYSHQDKSVLYTVVGNYEREALVGIVQKADPKAFINITDSYKVVGNFFQKPYY